METGIWGMETRNSKLETRKSKIENRGSKQCSILTSCDLRFSNFALRAVAGLVGIAAFALAFAYPAVAYAQGCPLCYNTAAAANAAAIQALRSGILILIIPPLAICAGILWLGIKARNRFNEPESAMGELGSELGEMMGRARPAGEGWKIEERKSKIAPPAESWKSDERKATTARSAL
jgi:hypothetical protein